MSSKSFIVENENEKQRLDQFLLEKIEGTSRSQLKLAIDAGQIFVNGKVQKAGYALKAGDEIWVDIPEKKELSAKPENIEIDVVYEDEHLAVINKEQGMVVHPAVGNAQGTLVNALTYRFNSLSHVNGDVRPGIVHRLDKDTSGLLVVAKTDEAHRALAEQIEKKIAIRKYYALLEGALKEDDGTIDQNLKRSDKDRKKYAVCEKSKGKRAITHFKTLEVFKNVSLVEFRLETGRTHQIRVHSAFINHPVVGDPVYGYKNQRYKTNGQLLHSHYLGFYHPTTKKWIEFETGMPQHFEEVLQKVKNI